MVVSNTKSRKRVTPPDPYFRLELPFKRDLLDHAESRCSPLHKFQYFNPRCWHPVVWFRESNSLRKVIQYVHTHLRLRKPPVADGSFALSIILDGMSTVQSHQCHIPKPSTPC